jgi:hypothetical protein
MHVFRAFFEVREYREGVARFLEKRIIYFQEERVVALYDKRIERIHKKYQKITDGVRIY